MARYENGRQVPDPRPVEVPTGLRVGPTLQEEIKRYVRAELSRRAMDNGRESFEEANDFDVDDDLGDLVDDTQYTVRDLIPEGPKDASEAPPGPSIGPDPTPAPPPAPAAPTAAPTAPPNGAK